MNLIPRETSKETKSRSDWCNLRLSKRDDSYEFKKDVATEQSCIVRDY